MRLSPALLLFVVAPAFAQTTQPTYYDLQAAIDAATKAKEKTVALPAGDYLVAKPAKITGGACLKIVGHGRGTTLSPSKTFPAAPLLSLEGAGQGCILADFRLVNLANANVESLIRCARPAGVMASSGLHSLSNVWVIGRTTRACLDIDGSEGCTLTKCVGESLNASPALLIHNRSGGMQTYQEWGCCWTNKTLAQSIRILASGPTPVSDLHFRSTVLNGGGITIDHQSGQMEMLVFEGVRAECGGADYVFTVSVGTMRTESGDIVTLAAGPITVRDCILESKVSNWKSTGAISQLTWTGNKSTHDFSRPTIDAARLDWSTLTGGTANFLKADLAIGCRVTVNQAGRVDGVPAERVTRN